MKARSSGLLILSTILLLAALALGISFAQGRGIERQVMPAQSTQPYKAFLPVVMNIQVSVPRVSTSMYMVNIDPQAVYNEGCKLGQRDLALAGKQDSVVFLAFGYPQYYGNDSYGTRGYAYPPKLMTTAQIASVAENFGYGYWYCVGEDYESHLRIAIGTSNYPGDAFSSVSTGHGKAWAQMVNAVNDWFLDPNNCDRQCDHQVDAVGASDIELAWNQPGPTTDWVNGYASAAKYPMYNFGAAEGCPWLAHPTYKCAWGDLEKALYVMWRAPFVQPMPEIYLTSGVNAEQWYLMSVYSYTNHQGDKIQFVGPMSEYQACQQEGGCPGIDNKPEDAWHQLYYLLNSDWRTSVELPYLTDILWFGRY